MIRKHGVAVFTLAICALAADKIIKPATSGNELVDISGTAALDRPSVTAALGMDPKIDLVVVDIKVMPKGDNKIAVYRDDFTLIARNDGQRSEPLSPGQIAGRGAIMVSSTGPAGGSGMAGNRGPIWGGIPGVGGAPRRMGGDGEAMAGGGSAAQVDTKISNGEGEKDNPLLATLKAKILPEKETNEEVSGQLYFILEGKHKLKDLDLIYKTASGKLILDFVK